MDLKSKSDEEIDTWILNYEKNEKTTDPFYLKLIQEQSSRKNKGLEIATSLALLVKAAEEGRFVSYGDLAKVNGVEWKDARHAMNGARGHLDSIVSFCHARGLPLLSAICVNAQSLQSGDLEPNALKGFIAAAHRLKIPVADEAEFFRKCQRECFDRAKSESLTTLYRTGK